MQIRVAKGGDSEKGGYEIRTRICLEVRNPEGGKGSIYLDGAVRKDTHTVVTVLGTPWKLIITNL